MLRSSTSSSERLRPWRAAALIALGVLLVAEAGLRVPAVASVLGPPDLYYHPGVGERIDALEALQARGLEVDALFVGSSVVRTNISPLVFDDTLREGGLDVVSFNTGMSALRPDPVRLYLEHLWLDAARPRVVFQAVRYEDVAEAVPVDEFEPFDGGRYEQLWLKDAPFERAQEKVLDASRLFQYAGLLTQLLAFPEGLRDEGFEIDERGFNQTRRHLSDVRAEVEIVDIPGGEAASHGYDFPIDDATYALGFEILAATDDLVRERGATLVLINMPEHADKFIGHRNGPERYAHYIAALREFAAARGIPFIDLAPGGLGEFEDDRRFADFNHMTPEAARWLTQRLASAVLDKPEVANLLDTD